MKKKELRKQMKQLRAALTMEQRTSANNEIRERLLAMQMIQDAEWILPFVSYGTEVDTIEIIKALLLIGKKIALPKVTDDRMDFYEITDLSQLESGYMGILEPVTEVVADISDAVMFMPGLVFDLQKNRIGYGGGFYDKYLAEHSRKLKATIALAFEFQVLKEEKIVCQEHDIRPDYIVTEKNIY